MTTPTSLGNFEPFKEAHLFGSQIIEGFGIVMLPAAPKYSVAFLPVTLPKSAARFSAALNTAGDSVTSTKTIVEVLEEANSMVLRTGENLIEAFWPIAAVRDMGIVRKTAVAKERIENIAI
jgi:hypothetical protein